MRIVKVTVSIGVAQYQGDRKAFFANADRALYRAKAEGKDCVVADAPASAPVPAHPA
jgi:PleD family two-component response regulator